MGLGIRFVLFLQGCHLKCKYCHNRDTWDLAFGKEMSANEIFDKIVKYKNYIHPEGGVTVTGGEPLLQSSFLVTLFTMLKKEGIHTCLDTSGIISLNDNVKQLLALTDLVLLDIKHIDNTKCIELTKASNTLGLEFAKYLSAHNIPMWIRQVIIPGITDDKEDLIKLKAFINSLSTVQKIELLPYHTSGNFKWTEMGEKYLLDGVPNATLDDISRAKSILGI